MAAEASAQPGPFVEDTSSALVSDGARGWLGAYWGDVDADGDLDLLATDALRNDRLYFNEAPGEFEGVSLTVSPYREVNGGGWVDVDRDGDLDFLAASIAGSALLLNPGSGIPLQHVFSAIDAAGARDLTAGDYDRDGDPDLVLVPGFGGSPRLFRNTGVGLDFGQILSGTGDGTTACWGDFHGDHAPDLLVVNASSTTSVLYRNEAGVLVEIPGSAPSIEPGHSQGCSWGDYDGDGDMDLFVARGGAVGQADRLYRNDEGTLVSVTDGPIVTDGAGTFGSAWGDVDNDGDLDLVVVNRDAPDMLYLNEGGEFEPVMFGSSSDGWSLAATLVDHDEDGDLDLFTTHGSYGAFSRNRHFVNASDSTHAGRHWLGLDLKGVLSDRYGLGARATVHATIGGSPRQIVREVVARSGRMAQDGYRLHFGLGEANAIDSLTITWPVSGRAVYHDVPVDSIWTIEEDGTVGNEPPPESEGVAMRAAPNPATGRFVIVASGLERGPVHVTLFDGLGRRVADAGVVATGATARIEWPESAHLSPGRYIARLENGAGDASAIIVVR